MATSKEYAYYIKGNKVAIVQKDWTSSGGQTLSQPGLNDLGAQGALLWNSPKESITDGLELQYVYSPQYTITTSSTTQVNKFYINGWTVKNGYLTFLRSHSASVPSWDASPYSAAGDDEYIVVSGSERWNGLHRVKDGATDGTLQTYTRVNKSVQAVVGSSSIDITAEEDTDSDGTADRSRIAANNSSNIWLNNIFSTGDYIFVSGSEQAVNNGFWKISDVQADSSNEIDSGIYVTNRYYCYNAANTLSTEGIDTIPDTYATYDESVTIYKAYRDFCYLQSDVDVLNDESDELDIPRYLANAIVYYVKAKYAEDAGELEMKEYFMREFRRITEKHQSAKKMGTYIAQGLDMLRS